MNEPICLAIIAGSGFYDMPGLNEKKEHVLDTPFGAPSAPILVGKYEGKRIAFLARHGIGHHILPGEVNYRANIFALKLLGVQNILAINACGSLREDYSPGHLVIPDQIFDHTRQRANTFFGGGLVAHVGAADPFCPRLSASLESAIQQTGIPYHIGGTLIIIEGPRFSTKAESQAYRSWGMSIIGMTTAPEVFLAREAEMCYTTLAHVTDYDVWHINESPVTVEVVLRVLENNSHYIQEAIRNILSGIQDGIKCTCASSLESAIITDPERIPPSTREKLSPLIQKYIK